MASADNPRQSTNDGGRDDACLESTDNNMEDFGLNRDIFYPCAANNDATIIEEGEESEGVILDEDILSSDEKKCKCEDCGKVFNSVWYLKQHAVKHSAERPYKCRLCNKTYRFRSNLYQHKCHSRDVLGSSMYPHFYPNPHRTNRPSRGVGRCSSVRPPAALGFDSNYSQQPGTSTSPRNESPLDFINKTPSPRRLSLPSVTPPTPEEVKKFVEKHSHELHKCTRCEQLFPSREYLTRHMSWHEDLDSRQKNKCSLCSEIYEDEQAYGLHKQLHVPSSPYVCQACRGKFCHRVALKKHSSKCTARRKRDIFGLSPSDSPSNRDNSTFYSDAAMFFDRTPPSSPNVQETGEEMISTPPDAACGVLTTPIVKRDNETDQSRTGLPHNVANNDHCYQKDDSRFENNIERNNDCFDLISNQNDENYQLSIQSTMDGGSSRSGIKVGWMQSEMGDNFSNHSSTKVSQAMGVETNHQNRIENDSSVSYYDHRPSFEEFFSSTHQPWYNAIDTQTHVGHLNAQIHSFHPGNAPMDVVLCGDAPLTTAVFDIQYNANKDHIFTKTIAAKSAIFAPLDENCSMAVDLMPRLVDDIVSPGEWPAAAAEQRVVQFESSTIRKRPLTATTTSNPFQCGSCAGRFRSASALRDHMIRKHSSDAENESKSSDNSISCEPKLVAAKCSVFAAKRVCLSSPQSANASLRAPSGSHCCNSCGRSFRRREHLDKHRSQNHCLTAMLAITTAPTTYGNDAARSVVSPFSQLSPQNLTKEKERTTTVKEQQPATTPAHAAIILVPPKPPPNANRRSTAHRSMSGATRSSRAKTLRNARPEECRCRYCPKTFFYKRYVRKHERLQHELPRERQGESSSLVYNLKNADLYKIRCPLCVKRFSSQRLLKQHLAFHGRANKLEKEKNK